MPHRTHASGCQNWRVAQDIAELGEFGLIERIRAALSSSGPVGEGEIGIGDDAAVLAVDGMVVASTDMLVEGVHFRMDWSSAADVGHRAAAANLSDVVAMGARPTALLLGLALPGSTDVGWVEDFCAGFAAEASSLGARVVGGDTVSADKVVVSVTALGQTRQVVTRSGAAPGDVVAVAGRLGWAAAGQTLLTRGFRSPRVLVDAFRRPEPPYGSALGVAGRASAMIDVSDGLIADLGHLATASGVDVELDSALLPVDEQLRAASAAFASDALEWVLTGGEDHAFAATFPAAEVPDGFVVIGKCAKPSGADGPEVRVDGVARRGGYEHFRG